MPSYNYFPTSYQPMQPMQYQGYQQPQMSYAPQPQPQSGIIWVQGEAGAKAYPVAAGLNILLMDSESECFYIKSTDASGMPMPLRTFEYHEVVNAPMQSNTAPALPDFNPDKFATKEDLQQLTQKIDDIAQKAIEKGKK